MENAYEQGFAAFRDSKAGRCRNPYESNTGGILFREWQRGWEAASEATGKAVDGANSTARTWQCFKCNAITTGSTCSCGASFEKYALNASMGNGKSTD